MLRIAIESFPNSSVTTTGRLVTTPVPRIATCGRNTTGVSNSAPREPVLVDPLRQTVYAVPPQESLDGRRSSFLEMPVLNYPLFVTESSSVGVIPCAGSAATP